MTRRPGDLKLVFVNAVWVILLTISLLAGALSGKPAAVGEGALNAAGDAVKLAIGLVGVMSLWLGLMRVAEEAGLVKLLARAVRFVLAPLFREVPRDHPALSAIFMNISANAFGLGNAATPLGIKAMEELQTLNPQKERITNAQALFVAINTASVTLIPATVIALRVSAHSKNPAEIILPTLGATACALTAAIVTAKLLEKRT